MPATDAKFRPALPGEAVDTFKVVPLYDGWGNDTIRIRTTYIYADDADEARRKWHRKFPLGIHAAVQRIEAVVEIEDEDQQPHDGHLPRLRANRSSG